MAAAEEVAHRGIFRMDCKEKATSILFHSLTHSKTRTRTERRHKILLVILTKVRGLDQTILQVGMKVIGLATHSIVRVSCK